MDIFWAHYVNVFPSCTKTVIVTLGVGNWRPAEPAREYYADPRMLPDKPYLATPPPNPTHTHTHRHTL